MLRSSLIRAVTLCLLSRFAKSPLPRVTLSGLWSCPLVCLLIVITYFSVEESSEFLQPVDSNVPMMLDRRDMDRSLESIKTKLCPPSSAAYFTYNCVAWKLNIKKEVILRFWILSYLDQGYLTCLITLNLISHGYLI